MCLYFMYCSVRTVRTEQARIIDYHIGASSFAIHPDVEPRRWQGTNSYLIESKSQHSKLQFHELIFIILKPC